MEKDRWRLPVGALQHARKSNHLCTRTVYQAGPLSGNPLAMSAGMAMLTHLNNHPEIFTSLAGSQSTCIKESRKLSS
jgi:glutamate-1-semialdehyde 2,1-aminomutase